jgi:transcription elongation factor Elf1
MAEFIDIQYAQMLSGRLEHFKIKHTNPYKINFRCPICGDSTKNRSKARGWLLERDNKFSYYCHNCGASQSFNFFLKTVDPLLFNDYITEKFVANTHTKDTKEVNTEQFKSEAVTFNSDPLKKIKKISQLEHDHPVKRYILKRQIPSHQHYRLYFAPKFKAWINEIIPDKFDPEKIGKDEPRLVIPFLDENGKCFGVSARSFDPKTTLRYISILFDNRPKIFGLDKVNLNEPYYIVEGALDSMFLSNAISMNGAEGNGNSANENAIYVFDAEPRNKEIHSRMEKVIKNGHKICIWPSDVPGKDINEMILNGLKEVEKVIEDNTYKGLQAELKFAAWRKT